MKFFFESIRTFSYWRYALFSRDAAGKLLAVMGALYLFIELLDTFEIYKKDRYGSLALIPILGFAVIYVIVTRRPVTRIRYKVPKKDLSIEVRIGDIFKAEGEVVISSSSTFDTEIANGLISPASVQGQLALTIFNGKTEEMDRQIKASLKGEEYVRNERRPGNKNEYPIGTTALVRHGNRNFYLVAMSHFNEHGTAESSSKIIEDALVGLWSYLAAKGELGDVVIPLLGTGRGRVNVPRKKMIERIAQSFVEAVEAKAFSNRLVIVVHPDDAARFALNLYRVRDYLVESLQV